MIQDKKNNEPAGENPVINLKRTEKQKEALINLAMHPAIWTQDLKTALMTTTEIIADCFEVDRASIWKLSDDGRELICLNLFERAKNCHSAGEVLYEKDFSSEFTAFKTSRYVDAHDALTDPRTAGYVESYLKPLSISSMLDASVRNEGVVIGLVCLEHVGEERRWQSDEITLACAISDHVSLLLANNERKKVESALRESESKFRDVFDSASDAIFIHDASTGNILDVNQTMIYMYGWSRDECNTLSTSDLSAKTSEYSNEAALDKIRQANKIGLLRFEWVARRRDGSLFPADVTLKRTDIAGKACIIANVRDITERKHVEREKEKLIQKLEAKNSEMEKYTYTVSHDLKAPLITIMGFLGYLKEDIEKGNLMRAQEDIQRISKSTIKMDVLLQNLLKLSIIGKSVDDYTVFPMSSAIEEALEQLEGLLKGKNIKIDYEKTMPLISGDKIRIVEVWQNLIENAIKYIGENSNPEIAIGAEVEGNENIYFIKDNGIGIEPIYHKKIFGLFEKLDPNIEGTGIGLAIVKRIIDFHCGKIWVESEGLGKGSTFNFTVAQNLASE